MSISETPSPPPSGTYLWSSLGGWLKRGIHPAPWLPPGWHHPALGYLAALLLELITASLMLLLQMFFPFLDFLDVLLVLVIVLIALSWGQGPSLLATFLGAFLLIGVIGPPAFSWDLNDAPDFIDLCLYLATGVIISLLAGQTGRARWQAEQLAHEAEVARRFLARVLEALPVGVCLVDTTGRLLERNAALESLGVDMTPLVAWVLGQEEPILAEERAMTTSGGEVKTLLTFAVPVGDDLGVVQGGVVVVVDISERKQFEEALRVANRRMDAFLGIASHELRTPLTTLKLHLQVFDRAINKALAQQPADLAVLLATLQSLLEQGHRRQAQLNRLNRLVNDLLDTSRLQAGRLDLCLGLADLRAIVNEAIEEQRLLEPQRTIQFQLFPEQPVHVQGDAERLGQVVTNYLTNALKYSREDQSVTVGMQADGEQARVWVHDEGPGIPLPEQAHIWERFHRVPGMEVQYGSGVGLGLGLHISQEIIERHHGQVGVESAPGRGSTFWFSLPLAVPG